MSSKPVEIEFLMRDKVSPGMAQVEKGAASMGKTLDEVSDNIRVKLEEQSEVVKLVESDLDDLERKMSTMKPGHAWQEMEADINACRKVLIEEKGALDEIQREYDKAVGSAKNLSVGLEGIEKSSTSMSNTVTGNSADIKSRLKEQREVVRQVESDLKDLEKQLSGMAPGKGWAEMKAEVEACKIVLAEEKGALAEIEQAHDKTAASGKRLSRELTQMQDAMARMRMEGKQLTPEYAELEQKTALLADTLADVRNQTNILAHDNAGLQGMISGVSGLTGGITAAVGVMGVFTKNNEDLAKVQTKVQSVMAITMGLQQVMNTLNKDSAFRLVTVKKMKEGLAVANNRLAVSLGISTVAAKALMTVLTAGLSVAIGAILVALDRFRSKQAKAREEMENFNQKVAETASQSVANFKKMVTEWERLPDSMAAKEKYIRDNQDAFKALGVEVNNVADAENLFVRNTGAFIESLKLRAQAAAAYELASEKYKDYYGKMAEADQMSDTNTRLYSGEGDSGTYEVENREKTRLVEKADADWAAAEAYMDKNIELTEEAARKMAEAGIATAETVIDGSVAAIEKVIASKKELLKKAVNAVEYNRIQREIEAEERKLQTITGNKNKNDAPKNNLPELELRARQRIEDQALALRQEGYDKERAAAELNFQREKERIEKEQQDRLALYEKLQKSGVKVTPEQKQTIIDQAAAQAAQAQQLYDQAVGGINKKQKEDETETYQALLEPYKTYAQKRLDIERQFNEDIQKLKEGGASAENIANAERARDKAVAELDATMGATTDFWGKLFDQFSHYTNKELQTIVGNAQEVLDYLNNTSMEDIGPKFGLTAEQLRNLKGNATELAAVYEALGSKIQELNQRNPFAGLIRGQKLLRQNSEELKKAQEELARAQSSGDKEAIKAAGERVRGLERQKALFSGDLKEAAKAAVSYLGDVGDSLQQIGEAAGDSGLASFGKALGEVTDIAAQALSGDYIGAAISAITTGLTAIFSSRSKYKAALKQMQDDQIAFAHKYKMIMSDIRLEAAEASNAFGDDSFAKAIAALKELKTNYEDFIRLVNKNDSIPSGAGMFDELRRARLEAKGITTDLQNIWIQTRHKTAFRSAKGAYLKDLYPELFENNEFNVEAARGLLATNNQLNDEAKRQMQEVIDLYDQWQEAEDAFKAYLSETFGDIGNSLGDSIVNAFKNGTNAMQEWGQSFDKVLENLGKQMMQTIFFQGRFDDLQEDVQSVYEGLGDDPNELSRQMQVILGNFYDGMQTTVSQASDWYQQWADMAKQNGFDLSDSGNDAQQSAKAGTFQTMTQDQASELKGLFTSVQKRLGDIDLKLDDLGPGLGEISSVLADIRENTRSSSDSAKKILDAVEKMIRDGLKMK